MMNQFEHIVPEYELISQEYIEEVKSWAGLLRHKKTGAKVAVWLFVKSWGKMFFSRHRNCIPVSLYVKDRKIRFLKFSKLRYPKAFRLITLIALFVPSVKPLV